jgi:hypothetical protein
MESIIQMLSDGLGFGDSVVEICRKRLAVLVQRGLLSDSECDEILSDIDSDLHEKRTEILQSIGCEMTKMFSIMFCESDHPGLDDHQSWS